MNNQSFQTQIDRLKRFYYNSDGPVSMGILATIILCLLVFIGATFPKGGGNAAELGNWKAPMEDEALLRLVYADYDPQSGSLSLKLDDTAKLKRSQNRFMDTHLRKFNKVASRGRYKRPVRVRGEKDGIFAVDIIQSGQKLKAVPTIVQLSAYNQVPIGERQLKELGKIHLSESTINEPYLSDGYQGFFLEPSTEGTQLKSKRVPLDQAGFYSGQKILLTDSKEQPRAYASAGPEGKSIIVAPTEGFEIFMDNGPPQSEPVTLEQADVVEIGGRFFEAHVDGAGSLAFTHTKGVHSKRIYPLGRLFHPIGPLALDGAHQSLGIEYMFQEYLMGHAQRGIPQGELWLTLERKLQADLNERIAALAKTYSVRETATGLIMNAKTGAILAMASEPNHYDPEDREQILELLRKNQEHLYNHGGFRRHVIGSVAKVFFSFMQTQIWKDDVNRIKIDMRGGRSREMFGHLLYGNPKAKGMKLSEGRINFKRYLVESDNPYQHSTGLLLLAGVKDIQDIPRPWGREFRDRFQLSPFATSQKPLEVGSMGKRKHWLLIDPDGPFASGMRDYFDIYTGGSNQLNDRDIDIYSPQLLDLAGTILRSRNPNVEKPYEVLKRRSVVCAPENTRMALDEVRNTMDASNVLYGANRNHWTDVKLCEAFSRIMTGKRVQARIISAYLDTMADTPTRVDLEALAKTNTTDMTFEYPEGVDIMKDALREVITHPEGTGRIIKPALVAIQKEIPGFQMYGKSGTIDDGRKGDPDSKLFVTTFGIERDGVFEEAYTFAVYLKNARDEKAPLYLIRDALPTWWSILGGKQ